MPLSWPDQPKGLDRMPGVHALVVDPGQDGGSRVRCEVDSDKLEDLLRVLVTAGVRTLVSQPPTLEELFLRHYSAGPMITASGDAVPGDAVPDHATGRVRS